MELTFIRQKKTKSPKGEPVEGKKRHQVVLWTISIGNVTHDAKTKIELDKLI